MRKLIKLVAASVLMVGVFVGVSSAPASASADPCLEIANAIIYHYEQGNYAYVEWLGTLLDQYNC